jgi:hypothetical protein
MHVLMVGDCGETNPNKPNLEEPESLNLWDRLDILLEMMTSSVAGRSPVGNPGLERQL